MIRVVVVVVVVRKYPIALIEIDWFYYQHLFIRDS